MARNRQQLQGAVINNELAAMANAEERKEAQNQVGEKTLRDRELRARVPEKPEIASVITYDLSDHQRWL